MRSRGCVRGWAALRTLGGHLAKRSALALRLKPGVNLFNSSGHGDGGGVPSDGGEEGGVLPSDALNRMMSLSRIAPVLLVRPGV